METAKLYRIEEMFKDKEVPTTNLLSLLKVKGSKPKNGYVRVNSSGDIAIALEYGKQVIVETVIVLEVAIGPLCYLF